MAPESETPKITGELHNWLRQTSPSGSATIIWGNVHGDVHGRFHDGQLIRTSKVVKIEGDLAHTLNSIYRLVGEEKTA